MKSLLSPAVLSRLTAQIKAAPSIESLDAILNRAENLRPAMVTPGGRHTDTGLHLGARGEAVLDEGLRSLYFLAWDQTARIRFS